MVFVATIEQNRSPGPSRYVRLVVYRRQGDVVTPYLWEEDEAGHGQSTEMRWCDIAPSQADPEYVRAWNKHIAHR